MVPASTTTEGSSEEADTAKMMDLTAIFQDAADSLTFRDAMICDRDSFNLQDSMAALEIMDRKMDCCEIPTSEVAPFGRETSEEDKNRMVFPRPLPIGLDDVVDPLPWNELTLEDVAYIALECLSRLESLLSGASVIESTYTCLYAHESVMADMKAALDPSQSEILSQKMQGLMAVDPDGSQRHLPQRVLFAAMLLLHDLTDVLRNVCLSADIFEEEDFTVSTYNAPTFGDRTDDSSVEAAKVALSDLSTLSQKDSDVVQGIRFMLEFQVEFLNVTDTMSKLGSKDVRKEAEKSQRLIRVTALKLEKLSLIAQRLKEKEKDSTKAILKRTFDSFATLPLVGNAPVRNIRFLDTDKAIVSLIKTTKELDWAVCGLLLNGNSLGRIRRMLARISLASPNIISRSLLVLNLFFDDQLLGQYSLSLMIMRHMQQLSRVPDDVFQTTTSQAFLGRLAKPVYDILKLMILNRNRQRAYIEVIILPDWGVLSQEAAVADTALKQDPNFGPDTLPHFSSYALYLTVESMDHFVALGIELGLYCSGYELFCAYWYRDFLLSALLSQVGMMRKTRLLAREIQQAALASASAKRGKKKGSKANKKPTQENTKADVEDIEDDLEFILASLKRVLCRGLMRFFASATQAGLLANTEFEFTSRRRTFGMRFKAFESITQPPPLSYEDFLAGSDFSNVAPLDLFQATAECFEAAKSYVDHLSSQLSLVSGDYRAIDDGELKELAKVVIGNNIYLLKLRQKHQAAAIDNGEQEHITCDTTTHRSFCTIKIS